MDCLYVSLSDIPVFLDQWEIFRTVFLLVGFLLFVPIHEYSKMLSKLLIYFSPGRSLICVSPLTLEMYTSMASLKFCSNLALSRYPLPLHKLYPLSVEGMNKPLRMEEQFTSAVCNVSIKDLNPNSYFCFFAN